MAVAFFVFLLEGGGGGGVDSPPPPKVKFWSPTPLQIHGSAIESLGWHLYPPLVKSGKEQTLMLSSIFLAIGLIKLEIM